MASLYWNRDLYWTGVSLVDRQSCRFIEIINKFHNSYGDFDESILLESALEWLREYTSEFHEEELVMERYEYPQRSLHQMEHRFFIRDLQEMQRNERFPDASAGLRIIKLYNRLSEWLVNHISLADRSWGAYLKWKTLLPTVSPVYSTFFP